MVANACLDHYGITPSPAGFGPEVGWNGLSQTPTTEGSSGDLTRDLTLLTTSVRCCAGSHGEYDEHVMSTRDGESDEHMQSCKFR
ncbi:hypothetical protein AXG93_1543s1470 [Marchantia polymorpha subsp. ruderalis]|uniref:Uncharacterized protein n=1 Tax=Marchantia polymorpha subsp. ruderalis TaxID=1480154 RepID=A0A176VXJ9_MARPO|nr:hypothetical protein AXG93_1543s1470 [Marchantia polymorpha subsp. ruderalis]